MNILKQSWSLVRQNWKAYLVINLAYYGTVIAGMVFTAFNPGVQAALLDLVGSAFDQGLLGEVADAYSGGELLRAIALTFVVNFLIGSLASITLPSLVIPFSGFLLGAYRAILWGLLLSPTDSRLALAMIPHSLTLLLEGQAYILALLAAYVQGRSFLWPATAGAASHRAGFRAGVRQTVWLYALVILFLAVAAVYEAIEVIAMTRWIGPG